jgi:hypothetical protein
LKNVRPLNRFVPDFVADQRDATTTELNIAGGSGPGTRPSRRARFAPGARLPPSVSWLAAHPPSGLRRRSSVRVQVPPRTHQESAGVMPGRSASAQMVVALAGQAIDLLVGDHRPCAGSDLDDRRLPGTVGPATAATGRWSGRL